jgi:hypothetical protein
MSSKKGSKAYKKKCTKVEVKEEDVQMDDPMLPFSVTISKEEVPRAYCGIDFDPQIFLGAQANGFFGNIRFSRFGGTRVFFFQIQPGRQNMSNYYTIAVVVPGAKSDNTCETTNLEHITDLCVMFEDKNSDVVNDCQALAREFVNLAVRHVRTDDWGASIDADTPVQMTIVFNQFDLGQLGRFYDSTEFPVAKIDFSQGSQKKGGRRKNSKKRKGSRKRKTIRRK